jgi:T4 RnlA family RNA ligase
MHNLVTWFKEKGFSSVVEGKDSLTAELGIKVKEYPEHDLYVFNYCQIESPKTHPVVMECRGLILDNNFTPVCRPFDRFFNHGEALNVTENFDITSSIVYEKLDGSLVKLFFWNDKWRVATRGTAFAESENYTGEVFESLITKAFGVQYGKLDEKLKNISLPKDCTFIFEYTSPNNRVVTPYQEDKMYLLGARHNVRGNEFKSSALCWAHEMQRVGLNVAKPKTFKFSSEEEMKQFVNSLDGLQEGVVAHDLKNDIRVKLKAEQYVAIHRLRGDSIPTPKRIMGLVVTNETEEYLAYFPEERDRFAPYMEEWTNIGHRIECVWLAAQLIQDQKEFALFVKENPFAFVLFKARAKKQEPLHVLNMLDINKKVKLLSHYMGIE